MLILVGLGNPGEKYARHRHNVGFMAVDAIADSHHFGPAREKFHGRLREGFLEIDGARTKAAILKPQIFMNESGRSVRAALDFYKLDPDDVVVFYDELDLSPGKLRIKTGGGAAGHNGIRSIDACIGNNFRRVRIGIGHPGDKSQVTNHVLGNFAKADQDWLGKMLDAIAVSAPFLGVDDQRFATAVAQRLAPPKPAAPEDKNRPPSTNATQTDTTDETEPNNPFAEAFRKVLGRKDQDKT